MSAQDFWHFAKASSVSQRHFKRDVQTLAGRAKELADVIAVAASAWPVRKKGVKNTTPEFVGICAVSEQSTAYQNQLGTAPAQGESTNLNYRNRKTSEHLNTDRLGYTAGQSKFHSQFDWRRG